jgi:hypothetical protein
MAVANTFFTLQQRLLSDKRLGILRREFTMLFYQHIYYWLKFLHAYLTWVLNALIFNKHNLLNQAYFAYNSYSV